MTKLRQVKWNIPYPVYNRIVEQLERYQKAGFHRNIGRQEYAIEALSRGLDDTERALDKIIAPSIIIPR